MTRLVQNVISLLSDDEQQQPVNRVIQHPKNNLKAPPRYVYDHLPSSTSKYEKLSQSKNVPLQIYKVAHKNEHKKPAGQKKFKCKLCSQKMQIQVNIFKCQKCLKCCHLQCMKDLSECPNCTYNWITYTTKNQKRSPPTEKNPYQEIPLNFKQRESPSEKQLCSLPTQDQIIDFGVLNLNQKKQVEEFRKKYPQFADEKNKINLLLPLEDTLIVNEPLLQELLKQQIKPLPEYQELPEYFDDLVVVWNFYASFESSLESKKISKYTIENFEDQLQTESISDFLTPLLQLLCESPKNANFDSLLRIFEDLNEKKMLRFVSKYFWTVILTSVLTNRRKTMDDKSKQLIEKLQQIFNSRKYDIDDFRLKIKILKLVTDLIEESNEIKNIIATALKRRTQESTKTSEAMNLEIYKIRNLKSQLAQKAQQIQQRINKIKESLPTERNLDLVSEFKRAEIQKATNLASQEELREKIKNIKQYSKIKDQLAQFEGCNKIKCMGKDRDGRYYWYFTQTDEPKILFLTEKSRSKQGQYNQWGFYYGSSIKILQQNLIRSGANEGKLNINLDKLTNYQRQIQIMNSQKFSSFKKNNKENKDEDQNQNYQEISTFLDENLKELNLSDLRHLLVQIHQIFSQFIEENHFEWEDKNLFSNKIKNQKFKHTASIKDFVVELADSIYELKVQISGKVKGRKKKANTIWINRQNIYFAWKKQMKDATKNSSVFMLTLVLYLETYYSLKNRVNEKKHMQPRFKKISSSSQNSSQISS